jgi:hypothetical protein
VTEVINAFMYGTLTLPAVCSTLPAKVIRDVSHTVSRFPVFGLRVRLGNFTGTLRNPVSAKQIT